MNRVVSASNEVAKTRFFRSVASPPLSYSRTAATRALS
jgi:hypothetical protein